MTLSRRMETKRSDRVLLTAGAVLALVGAAHGLLGLWLGGPWLGPLGFKKPVAFGLAFGLSAWSLAWALRPVRASWRGRAVAWLFSVSAGVEVALVVLQFWRGQPSHFNLATLDGAVVHWSMAAFAGALWLAVAGATSLAHRAATLQGSLRTAVLGGLWFLHASFLVGVVLSVHGTTAALQGAPDPSRFGAAGQSLPPHAVGLHAIQVLAGLQWFLRRRGVPEGAAKNTLWATIGALGAILAYLVLQMLTGRAPADPGGLGWALLMLAGVAGARAAGGLVAAAGARPVRRSAGAGGGPEPGPPPRSSLWLSLGFVLLPMVGLRARETPTSDAECR